MQQRLLSHLVKTCNAEKGKKEVEIRREEEEKLNEGSKEGMK